MPRPDVVLDTNVVVSAHLNPEGFERFVLDLGLARKIRICVSDAILEEYEGVLRRDKFGIVPEFVTGSLKLISRVSLRVRPAMKLTEASDPEDNKFLECAAASGATYLVTGNKRHYPKRLGQTVVVNAREFLEQIIPTLKR